ncbi:MAG: hypothetical protein EBV68_13750, partial [Betaproteobacteria bacterium]|nr:hypothetical protein [Betaproteobacteria bacterium]
LEGVDAFGHGSDCEDPDAVNRGGPEFTELELTQALDELSTHAAEVRRILAGHRHWSSRIGVEMGSP